MCRLWQSVSSSASVPRVIGPGIEGSFDLADKNMQILVLAFQKGGSRRSMLSAQLAVAAYEAGERVVVIDFDSQGSLMGWDALRTAEGIIFRTVAPTALNQWVVQSRKIPVVSLVIVDTAGAFGSEVDVALRHADFTLIPIRVSVLDLRASAPTARRTGLLGRPFGFVVNGANPTSSNRTNDETIAIGGRGPVGSVVSECVLFPGCDGVRLWHNGDVALRKSCGGGPSALDLDERTHADEGNSWLTIFHPSHCARRTTPCRQMIRNLQRCPIPSLRRCEMRTYRKARCARVHPAKRIPCRIDTAQGVRLHLSKHRSTFTDRYIPARRRSISSATLLI